MTCLELSIQLRNLGFNEEMIRYDVVKMYNKGKVELDYVFCTIDDFISYNCSNDPDYCDEACFRGMYGEFEEWY